MFDPISSDDDARRRAAFATVVSDPAVIVDTVRARYGWDEAVGTRAVIVTWQQWDPTGAVVNCVRMFD